MKIRLDEYISQSEQIELRVATTMIMSGKVLVDGMPETKPGRSISEKNQVILKERPREYPSRSAEKLIGALDTFAEHRTDEMIGGRICVDLGAAHGGFTRVLLDRGAARVYAIDVAKGLLDHSLQTDKRVVIRDRHNVKSIEASWFEASDLTLQPWFITCDVAFISLSTVLSAMADFALSSSLSFSGMFLLKPQFEASAATDRGVIRDEGLRSLVLEQTIERAQSLGYSILGTADSVLTGRKGNLEICLLLQFTVH